MSGTRPWSEEEVVLRNRELRVSVLPQRGAKIASIVLRHHDLELLYQPEHSLGPVRYGDEYDEDDSWGFDEMFPAIASEPYGRAPWSRSTIPDHGELWSQPWSVEALTASSVTLSVAGRRFPYLFRRTVKLNGRVLRLQYEVTNRGSAPFDGLWAAHPLLSAKDGAEVVPPMSFLQAEDTYNSDPRAVTLALYDRTERLLHLPSLSSKRHETFARKYYFAQSFAPRANEALLRVCGATPRSVTFRVDPQTVKFLGVWMNAGHLFNQHNIALEPATAPLDALSVARERGSITPIVPGETVRWWIEMECESR